MRRYLQNGHMTGPELMKCRLRVCSCAYKHAQVKKPPLLRSILHIEKQRERDNLCYLAQNNSTERAMVQAELVSHIRQMIGQPYIPLLCMYSAKIAVQ